MENIQSFQDFVVNQRIEISIWDFVINLFLATILSFLLNQIYIKYGNSLSNRKAFAQNFILITMTTTLIITVVKSSLALSLGLVGALSIVRFRTAIKDPEELSYLFTCIAIGLGLGADQRISTVLAMIIISGVIILRNHFDKAEEDQNLYLTVFRNNPKESDLNKIVHILKEQCSEVSLRRLDTSNEILEVSFLVTFDDFYQLESSKLALQRLDDSIRITFLDNKQLMSG